MIQETTPGPAALRRSTRSAVRGAALNITVMAVATGIVATLALPGYAVNPAANADGVEAAEALVRLRSTQSQSLEVEAGAAVQTVARDQFTATSEEELAAAQAAAAAAERRAQLAASYQAYSGPTTAQYLANPAYPNFSLTQVAEVAMQYQGVPYRYGGATPDGFDCSGLVMYVYAQFGIALPHGVRAQSSAGTPIDRSAAQPGDIVMFNDMSHNGIYMGNGMILDAPYPGKTVSIRPLWTDAYYIMRVGI